MLYIFISGFCDGVQVCGDVESFYKFIRVIYVVNDDLVFCVFENDIYKVIIQCYKIFSFISYLLCIGVMFICVL